MNPVLLACLIFSTLSAALSFTALVLVLRRPRQAQSSGPQSVQFQSGGSLTIDETAGHRAERIARDLIQNGRHL